MRVSNHAGCRPVDFMKEIAERGVIWGIAGKTWRSRVSRGAWADAAKERKAARKENGSTRGLWKPDGHRSPGRNRARRVREARGEEFLVE